MKTELPMRNDLVTLNNKEKQASCILNDEEAKKYP